MNTRRIAQPYPQFVSDTKSDNTEKKVPRIEDLPYFSSPPIQFVYQSQAVFSMGRYEWSDQPTALVPNRPIMINSLYYFRNITLSADIEEVDFTSTINVIPKFQTYLKSRATAILFREPVYMVKFFQNFDYRFAWVTQQNNDQLFASFNGILNQNSNLVGKSPITLTAIISAQEIVDEGFIKSFKDMYPG